MRPWRLTVGSSRRKRRRSARRRRASGFRGKHQTDDVSLRLARPIRPWLRGNDRRIGTASGIGAVVACGNRRRVGRKAVSGEAEQGMCADTGSGIGRTTRVLPPRSRCVNIAAAGTCPSPNREPVALPRVPARPRRRLRSAFRRRVSRLPNRDWHPTTAASHRDSAVDGT